MERSEEHIEALIVQHASQIFTQHL